MPLYVLYEHDDTKSGQADMARIMASPASEGLVARLSNNALYQGDASAIIRAFEAANGKPVRLCVSPQPGCGTPSIAIAGQAYALPTQALLDSLTKGWTFLANTIVQNGWGNALSARLCCMAPDVDDCEQGPPPGDMTPWIAAGLTNQGILDFETRFAAMVTGIFPGIPFSLSILDPRDWMLGDAGTILKHRDHGAFARRQVAAFRAGLSSAPLVMFNTNFSPDLPDATMDFERDMATDGLGLQLKDFPGDAAVLAGIDGAEQAGADEIEIHQQQATAGVLAALEARLAQRAPGVLTSVAS